MKKISLLLWVLCTSVTLFAQKSTTVKGFVKHKRTPEITLFEIENGDMKVYATATMGRDSSYRFTFIPKKTGFYAVGDRRMSFPIYVKGGEEINIDLLEKKAMLTGKNTKENQALYQWEDFANSIRYQSIVPMVMQTTYKEFFPEFTQFVTKLDSIKGAIKSGDPKFDELIRKKIDYDVDYYAMMFLMTPRTVHPQRSDWPAFYSTIVSDKKFTSTDVLQFPRGINMVLAYTNFATMSGSDRKGADALNNNQLKGETLLWTFAASAKFYPEYEIFIEQNDAILTPDQKERAKAIAMKLRSLEAGKPAKNFTYPDINGKEVSLSDFKGKLWW
ncbi:MAG: hypothetical protein ACLU4N_21120 [Butyricimonas faecihominis]